MWKGPVLNNRVSHPYAHSTILFLKYSFRLYRDPRFSVLACKSLTNMLHAMPSPVSSRPCTRVCSPARTKAVRINAVAAPQQGVSQLNILKEMTTVVADTGDIKEIARFQPLDCTTNPTLVLRALQQPDNQELFHRVLNEARLDGSSAPAGARPYADIADRLEVALGCEILKIISGRVSSEVDAHLSYDTVATYDKALRLLELYARHGVDPNRVYIKIASTWEGIRACERLEKEGINCNLTLLFNMAQAVACADAGASLVSPFVGRIRDWYMKKEGREYAAHEDPGVLSVQRIYNLYKVYNIPTVVMAASFRTADEIRELAGCDYLTVSPKLLEELEASQQPLERKLSPEQTTPLNPTEEAAFKDGKTESGFSALLAADDMASDLLQAGIISFQKDQDQLERAIDAAIQQQIASN